MKKISLGLTEYFPYFSAALIFFLLRMPLLPIWWADLHSDYALVGLMAQETKAGHFPIYYYGQNYMGGLEWLTAALLSRLLEAGPLVSLEVLRVNSLMWWFAAGVAWVRAIRLVSVPVSQLVAWLIAFGTLLLLQVSVLQELSPQAIFFGGLLFSLCWSGGFEGRRGWLMGLVLGLAWWTNQSVVFFLLPALLIFRAIPEKWHRSFMVERLVQPARGLQWLYGVAGFLIFAGIAIAAFGGLQVNIFGSLKVKIPNGISLARDAFIVLFLVQLVRALAMVHREKRWALTFLPMAPFAGGFLLGFSPVWLGRILGLYEKSYGVGLAMIPIKDWPGQAHTLWFSLYEVLFSRNWIVMATYGVVLGLGFYFGRGKKSPLVQFSVSVFLLTLFYVMFSERSFGVPLRYLYPCFFALVILTSALVISIRISYLRNACLIALLCASAYVSLEARNILLQRAEDLRPRKTNLESLQRILEGSNFTLCWGDYWSSYLFTYLTEGATRVSPHPLAPASQIRIKADALAVAKEDPACFLYRENDAPNAKIYFSGENPWVKK